MHSSGNCNAPHLLLAIDDELDSIMHNKYGTTDIVKIAPFIFDDEDIAYRIRLFCANSSIEQNLMCFITRPWIHEKYIEAIKSDPFNSIKKYIEAYSSSSIKVEEINDIYIKLTIKDTIIYDSLYKSESGDTIKITYEFVHQFAEECLDLILSIKSGDYSYKSDSSLAWAMSNYYQSEYTDYRVCRLWPNLSIGTVSCAIDTCAAVKREE